MLLVQKLREWHYQIPIGKVRRSSRQVIPGEMIGRWIRLLGRATFNVRGKAQHADAQQRQAGWFRQYIWCINPGQENSRWQICGNAIVAPGQEANLVLYKKTICNQCVMVFLNWSPGKIMCKFFWRFYCKLNSRCNTLICPAFAGNEHKAAWFYHLAVTA